MAKTKKATEIQQAAVYRCTVKETNEVFYLVKSDTTDTWYTLHFDRSAAIWACDCPATKPCKHIKAVNEVLAARRELLAERIGGDMPAIVAELQSAEDAKLVLVDEMPAQQEEQQSTEETPMADPAEALLVRERSRASFSRDRCRLGNARQGFQLLA